MNRLMTRWVHTSQQGMAHSQMHSLSESTQADTADRLLRLWRVTPIQLDTLSSSHYWGPRRMYQQHKPCTRWMHSMMHEIQLSTQYNP